jgi:hypothetical protein
VRELATGSIVLSVIARDHYVLGTRQSYLDEFEV